MHLKNAILKVLAAHFNRLRQYQFIALLDCTRLQPSVYALSGGAMRTDQPQPLYNPRFLFQP